MTPRRPAPYGRRFPLRPIVRPPLNTKALDVLFAPTRPGPSMRGASK